MHKFVLYYKSKSRQPSVRKLGATVTLVIGIGLIFGMIEGAIIKRESVLQCETQGDCAIDVAFACRLK